MKELKKKNKSINEWMDETEKLVNSLRVDMDARKATRIQQKINVRVIILLLKSDIDC